MTPKETPAVYVDYLNRYDIESLGIKKPIHIGVRRYVRTYGAKLPTINR